jgi:hypothetical protein
MLLLQGARDLAEHLERRLPCVFLQRGETSTDQLFVVKATNLGRPPNEGSLDRAPEVVEREWLGQVVRKTQVETFDPGLLAPFARDQEPSERSTMSRSTGEAAMSSSAPFEERCPRTG